MTAQPLNVRTLELLVAHHRNPSPLLRNQIVELNAGLVRQVAHRMSRQCSEPYEDLEQVGYLGLMNAIERFSPHQGYAFSSFAIPYIRGEILHYLRDKSNIVRIPRRWQELYSKGKKLRKQLADCWGRPPREQEIARALGVSLPEWQECQLALKNRLLVSLDATVSQTADSQVTLGDILPDRRCQVEQRLTEERAELHRAISQLEETTKVAIEWVFLRELPRKEAAKRIGLSPMTVTRRLQKGVKALGVLLDSQAA